MSPIKRFNPANARQGSSRSLQWLVQLAILLIAMVIFIGVLGPRRVIRCERTPENNVDCSVRKTLFGWNFLKPLTVAGVMAATLDERCNATDCAYALQLYGTPGLVVVDDHYTREKTLLQKVADQINDFLKNEQSHSIELTDQYPAWTYIAGGVILLALAGFTVYTFFTGRPGSE
jgi:hypothetical protein